MLGGGWWRIIIFLKDHVSFFFGKALSSILLVLMYEKRDDGFGCRDFDDGFGCWASWVW